MYVFTILEMHAFLAYSVFSKKKFDLVHKGKAHISSASGNEKVYVPLCKVADTHSYIQGGEYMTILKAYTECKA